jgi:hypothetical protein
MCPSTVVIEVSIFFTFSSIARRDTVISEDVLRFNRRHPDCWVARPAAANAEPVIFCFILIHLSSFSGGDAAAVFKQASLHCFSI